MISNSTTDVPVVVFADLDESLLDDRRCGNIDETALRELVGRSIPVILCSKRTRFEIARVRDRLGLNAPFICEDGGVLYVPRGWRGLVGLGRRVAELDGIDFGRPHREVLLALRRAATQHRVNIVTLSDLSAEAVSQELQLPILQSQLVKLRECSEPFRFVSRESRAIRRLIDALRDQGIGCADHSPYQHAGPLTAYAAAAHEMSRLVRVGRPDTISVAFGDNANDGPLLQAVDLPVIVRGSDSDPSSTLRRFAPRARVADLGSLSSWAALVIELAGALSRGRRSFAH